MPKVACSWRMPGQNDSEGSRERETAFGVISRHTHAVTVSVLIQVHCTPQLSTKLLGQLELSAASQANAKTNLIIISSNPAHYRLPNYPINSTSWESLFATQANVCSQISRQEDSSIVQTQGFDNAEQARLVTQGGRSSPYHSLWLWGTGALCRSKPAALVWCWNCSITSISWTWNQNFNLCTFLMRVSSLIVVLNRRCSSL